MNDSGMDLIRSSSLKRKTRRDRERPRRIFRLVTAQLEQFAENKAVEMTRLGIEPIDVINRLPTCVLIISTIGRSLGVQRLQKRAKSASLLHPARLARSSNQRFLVAR